MCINGHNLHSVMKYTLANAPDDPNATIPIKLPPGAVPETTAAPPPPVATAPLDVPPAAVPSAPESNGSGVSVPGAVPINAPVRADGSVAVVKGVTGGSGVTDKKKRASTSLGL